MSKDGFPDERPPAYNDNMAYPQQSPPAYTQPAQHSYPAQTSYPQQPAKYPQQPAPYPQQPAPYPQQPTGYATQPSVVSPNQVVIQHNLGGPGRQIIVSQGAQPAVNTSSTVVVQSQPMTRHLPAAQQSPLPMVLTCPNCQRAITTRVQYNIGNYTWLVAGILAILGCIVCAWVPCCMDSCKDAHHYCPACNQFLGHYSRLQL